MTADAWATAMMVMGVEDGGKIARSSQLWRLFQEIQEDMTVQETAFGVFATDESAVPAEASSPFKGNTNSMPWFPFAAAAAIFLLAIGGMAIGTMLQNKSLKGSCGGLA